MKNIIKHILFFAGVIPLSLMIWSCTSENPFDSDGEGVVQLRTVVNSITTRADEATDEYQEYLRNNCVVYISSKEGLIRKWRGLSNVDSQITLKAGQYVAEAWTGDSVSASWDKKFYRGYEPFDVTKGSTSNVVVNCKIANVVASVNTETIDPNLMRDDYIISIKNKAGELVFTKDNASFAKAYFMMPKDDSSLEYTITGTRLDGKPFSKSGTIENVEKAHHYILNFEYNPEAGDEPTGAVFIKIHIQTEDISDSDNVMVKTRPTISGIDFNIEKQQNYTNDENIPEEVAVQVCGFDGLDAVSIHCPDAQMFGINEIINDSVNLIKATNQDLLDRIRNAGIDWTSPEVNPESKVATVFLTFSKELIQKLTPRDTQYCIYLSATDNSKQTTWIPLRIARSEAAIIVEDPIVFDQVDQNNGFNITSNSVTLTYTLAEDIEGTPGVEYAKEGEDNWTFVAASSPSAISRNRIMKAPAKYTVTITGLEAGTNYKYRAACGDFHSDQIMKFETYTKFIIPNWNMEQWASISAGGQDGVRVPSRTGAADFWGNGNPGAKVAGEVLTDESTDMFHSATKSARLESKFASVFGIGKFAAGNLFAGEYVKTDGTDGVLKFGQPFADYADGKNVDVRPSAMRVWVNYRPKPGVNKKGAKDGYIAVGELDQAQIYVALTTAPVDIRTKSSDQKLFNPEDPEVLAYGQYTFEGNYGDDGQLKELVIPIEYFERSNGVLPTHLVIVCSASKYGDYFSGGEGSTMYLDDFELIYE